MGVSRDIEDVSRNPSRETVDRQRFTHSRIVLACSQSLIFPWDFLNSFASISNSHHLGLKRQAQPGESQPGESQRSLTRDPSDPPSVV